MHKTARRCSFYASRAPVAVALVLSRMGPADGEKFRFSEQALEMRGFRFSEQI